MRSAAKRSAPKQKKKGLTAFRWSVGFREDEGPVVQARADKQGTKVGIWLREAALQRIAREDAESKR